MADVLIVCVREDEPKAKSLAEMFEAAGFSIGGAPSSDGALRSSGAGLVVWSQASIRSRPFLDAAQRVINADKAVVASLIEPPPPSSIGDSPVFDLSRWDGDPNDPTLDPLFFAVDRMVNAARADVGASTAPAPAYEPPPQPRRAPPPPPAPAPSLTFTRPEHDPLSNEAEHWRAIRDSRNPSDFMDYLARFGPEGAFAEVAELRLKQLTAQQQQTEARAPAPRPAPPPPPPRPAPAPRVAMPPTRTEAPRQTTPPPRPRPEPMRRPPPERSYDRADLREPPRGEGGPLRAFVLVALLGAAALAGGLYFGGGMQDASERAQLEEPAAPLDQNTDATFNEEPASAPDPLTLAEAATPAPARRPEPAPPRRETTPPPTRNEEPTPAPTTTIRAAETANNTPANTGPVPLTAPPTNNAAGAPPAAVTPQPISPPLTRPASTPPVSRPAPANTAPAVVTWAQRPSARRIGDLYPDRALRDGVGGRVELNCAVRGDLSLNCGVATESPAGQGFGRAALAASNSYRANPTRSDGSPAANTTTRIVVQFQAAE